MASSISSITCFSNSEAVLYLSPFSSFRTSNLTLASNKPSDFRDASPASKWYNSVALMSFTEPATAANTTSEDLIFSSEAAFTVIETLVVTSVEVVGSGEGALVGAGVGTWVGSAEGAGNGTGEG